MKSRLNTASSLCAIAAALLLPALPAAAAEDDQVTPPVGQTTPAAAATESDDTAADDDMILVLGSRVVGQVEAAEPPLLELSQEDIAGYGAGSIAELLTALGPQVSSGRGRGDGGMPVILVNGVRISSFRELRSYPPEAIEKFEVFPEEVALRYGYSADQRVVNVILKDNFSSREIEGEYGQPWRGGNSTQEVEATYVRIDGPSRLNLNLEWNNSSLLTEAERGVIQSSTPTYATDPDPALYRSLVADTAGLESTLNWSTRVGAGNSLSVNLTYERDDTLRYQGIDTVLLTDPNGAQALRSFNADDPLTVDSRNQTLSSGTTLDLNLGDWQLTGTVDATYGRTRSFIQRRADSSALVAAAAAGTLALDGDLGAQPDAGFDEARNQTYTANALVTARTRPVYLPGGDVSLTLTSGYRWNRIEGTDTRNPGLDTNLSRGRLASSVNLGVPITSRDEDFGAALGDISLNLTAGVDKLSDFGTLVDWNAGVTWGLTEKLALTATYINRDTAPSLTQLGQVQVATPNVTVYDLVRGESALVTVITGGNAALPKQSQSDWKLGLQWQLPVLDNANFSFEYINNSSTNVTASFPTLTAEIEAAFADRVVRDASGRLVQVDQRPVTFARQDTNRLQVGLNLSGQIGSSQASGGGSGGARSGGAAQNAAAAGAPVGGYVGNGGTPAATSPMTTQGAAGAFQPNPERLAQMRATFCNADPATLREQLNAILRANAAGTPAPTGPNGETLMVPPQMLARLAGDDGVIDEAEFDTARTRICSAEGPGGPNGAPGGFGGDPQRLAAIRTTFCGADAETLRAQLNAAVRAAAAGEPPPVGADGQLLAVPPEVLQRMAGEDGVIDEAEFAAIRTRICTADGAAPPQGDQQAQGQQGRQGGFAFGGPPPGAGGPGAGGPGPGPGGGGGFRMGPGGMGGRGGSGGRWFVNLQYAYELKNEVLIAPGVPVLDLLDGDSNSARHSATLRFGTFYRGFGMMWDGRYTGSSFLEGSGLPGSTDLNYGDYAVINVRTFVDLGQQASLVEDMPILKGARISFSIDNLFDTRQRITDSTGAVPLSYQPFLVDPVGRSFEIEFRKIF
jgi:iron complex outermembrane receptor protein